MEIYNPMLEKKEKKEDVSKSEMEILTEYIVDMLNEYIEHEKESYKYVNLFKGLLPAMETEVIDLIVRESKNLIKSLITNDVDLFVRTVSRFGTKEVNFLSKESQQEFCNNLRLELYRNAKKCIDNK